MKPAFKTAITRIFNDYARKHGLLKENRHLPKGDDVREGLTAVISVKLKDAQFEGQTKAKLGNTAWHPGQYPDERKDRAISGGKSAVAKGDPGKSINAARVRERRRAGSWPEKKSGLSSHRMPEKLADCIWSDKRAHRAVYRRG